jgi:hypothetical protein
VKRLGSSCYSKEFCKSKQVSCEFLLQFSFFLTFHSWITNSLISQPLKPLLLSSFNNKSLNRIYVKDNPFPAVILMETKQGQSPLVKIHSNASFFCDKFSQWEYKAMTYYRVHNRPRGKPSFLSIRHSEVKP